MNVKKSKHKRTKNSKVSSPQNVPNEISDLTQEIKCDEQVICEVKEICVECIASPKAEEQQQQEAPVKPKRKKGKKKKQEEITDDNQISALAIDEVQESQLQKINIIGQPSDTQSDGEIDNKSTSRKKKKSKKIVEKVSVEETTENLQQPIQDGDASIVRTQDISILSPEEAPKKKHKKKKHPIDSTKSEDATCISAFQELLEREISQEEMALSDSICVIALTEENTGPQNILESLSTGKSKSKKKNKKDKNNALVDPIDGTKSEDATCMSVIPKLLQPERSHEEIVLSESSCAETVIQENTDSQHVSESVSINKSKSKKKNKKDKKNTLIDPIDGIKSGDAACILPLQKILEPEKSQEAVALSENSCTEDLIQETTDSQQTLELLSTSKSKNKTKKDKTSSVANVTEKEKEKEDNNDFEKAKQDDRFGLLECKSDVVMETSPKPKAKIAKPVDKKDKDKRSKDIKHKEIESEGIIRDENTTLHSKNVRKIPEIIAKDKVNTKAEGKEAESAVEFRTDSSIITMEPVLQSVIDNIPTVTPNSDQDKKSEVSAFQEGQSHEDNQWENTPFTEVRPSRKKKRTGKTTDIGNAGLEVNTEKRAQEIDISLDTSTSLIDLQKSSNLGSEETNVTPDFIHYPRSSSQQQLDNNNNMMIREISSPDEVRLAIPILMSTPVIQGSGESPEVRSKMDPLNLEVTEINVAPPNPSEYDMTSKTFEDILELKSSIEKSLAEIKAIEKSELEAEKEFEEVLAYNIKNRPDEKATEESILLTLDESSKPEHEKNIKEDNPESCLPPVCPIRKDKKGKSKKKYQKSLEQTVNTMSTTASSSSTISVSETKSQETSKTEDKEQKSENQETKNKQQSLSNESTPTGPQESLSLETQFEPIEKFEDALTSSTEDINNTFELIAKEAIKNEGDKRPISFLRPEISITEPEEDRKKEENAKEKEKKNPVSQPKNLLGQFNIPVQSNKTDYKKEKNKPPSTMQAKVKIKDATDIEKCKQSKESQTSKNKIFKQQSRESFSYKTNENDDFVYKYSFRKVFLPNVCHVCRKELGQRVTCKFCNLVFYCSQKHKDEDWSLHQFLCFAVSTIAHLKEQKFIYGDVKNIMGQDYRILRMQTIMSCEKMLKRKLVPWEQEALLYPRICSDPTCREWKQSLLTDCEGCGQVAFCNQHPEHLPISHQRWCKSYALYQKLVSYQQNQGRLEPRLPSKVLLDNYQIPEKINEVLATLYEEKIDMTDIQYAALTQIATAPLTAAFSYQITKKNTNGLSKKSTFSIHIVGAELQYEADVLNKWEIFFLHLRPDVNDLRVILISPDLNPSNLPLDLLSKVKLCDVCHSTNRRLLFHFEDKKTYQDYYSSDEFILPDIVCAFNSSIERASIYNNTDHWPSTIACISKLKTPLLLTAYTTSELIRDISRVKLLSDFSVISEPRYNSFASVRPDRNFITDDEMPLLFKNYCFSVVCGA